MTKRRHFTLDTEQWLRTCARGSTVLQSALLREGGVLLGGAQALTDERLQVDMRRRDEHACTLLSL